MQGIRNFIARRAARTRALVEGDPPNQFVRLMPIFWIHYVPDDEYDELWQTISYAGLGLVNEWPQACLFL